MSGGSESHDGGSEGPAREPGPEHDLSRALAKGLRDGFAGREATALHLAELILDVTEPALELSGGGVAAPALSEIELCATRIDVYTWDGVPGWDEVLLRGLARPGKPGAAPDRLSGLGEPSSRESQLALCEERAREEARLFVSTAKDAAAGSADLASVHASLLRLAALAAVHPLLALPEDLLAGSLPPNGGDALVREMDERAALGSDFASAQEEWLARLQAGNPAAEAPSFRPFFAGISQTPRLALALRSFRDAAREGAVAADLEPLVGAAGAWQPVRWSELRKGIPAAWTADLFPPLPPSSALGSLAAHCEAALDAAGRLFYAKSLSTTGFAALACALFARSACALSLRDQM
jgi:hypothetical protein